MARPAPVHLDRRHATAWPGHLPEALRDYPVKPGNDGIVGDSADAEPVIALDFLTFIARNTRFRFKPQQGMLFTKS
jgi:hypothetical protein